MSQPGIQRHFKASPQSEPGDPDPEVISESRSFEEIRAERVATVAQLTTLWQLPDRLKKRRGAPTYDSKWLAGLHDLVTATSLGQIREPPAEYILGHCPPWRISSKRQYTHMYKRVPLYKWLLCFIAFDSEENCTNLVADISFFIAENNVFEQF